MEISADLPAERALADSDTRENGRPRISGSSYTGEPTGKRLGTTSSPEIVFSLKEMGKRNSGSAFVDVIVSRVSELDPAAQPISVEPRSA